MPDSNRSEKFYRRSLRTSFFLVLFLVLIGGVVRSTGAGMGCPDWPKCFGLWIPPVSISEIPAEFWNHPLSSENGKVIFNPVKTWTEYLNRLLGVLIGFSILVQAVSALFQKGKKLSVFYSMASLILVLFQGWLGSRVVSSDLKPLIISIHLLVALVIALSILSALFFASKRRTSISAFPKHPYSNLVLYGTGLVIMVQFVFGTEVRSQVDSLFREFDFGSRSLYVERLDWKFLFHRSFSTLALLFMILQPVLFVKQLSVENSWISFFPLLLAVVLMISGYFLVSLGFPAFLQPFHLLLGFSIVCSQFWLFLHLKFLRSLSKISA